MLGAHSGLHLEELAVVDHGLDDVVHVVRLVGAVGDDRVEREVLVGGLEVGRVEVGAEDGRVVQVVARQVRQQRAGDVEASSSSAATKCATPLLALWVTRPAELLELDVLAGDGLDHVGAGDEHVRGLVDHHGEVGDGGGVDGAAGARAHDQRDLRDDARAEHVAAEDLAVQAQRGDALLDAGAAGVVDADDRAAGLQREVHDLDDLLAEDLAEAAAEDGEVLGEHADLAAVDRAVAGDHAVAVRALLVQAERAGAVAGQRVESRRRSPRRGRPRCARGRSACPWRAAPRSALAEPAWAASSCLWRSWASLPAVVRRSGPAGASAAAAAADSAAELGDTMAPFTGRP